MGKITANAAPALVASAAVCSALGAITYIGIELGVLRSTIRPAVEVFLAAGVETAAVLFFVAAGLQALGRFSLWRFLYLSALTGAGLALLLTIAFGVPNGGATTPTIITGLVTGLGALIHWSLHRALGPNNSSKPTPLRGAA